MGKTQKGLLPDVGSRPFLWQCHCLSSVADFRSLIRPKHAEPDAEFEARPYWRVFGQKNGFLPNLSVLDLLFNMGNEAVLYL